MFYVSQKAIFPIALCCVLSPVASAQQHFQGKLQSTLTPEEGFSVVALAAADSQDLALFVQRPTSASTVRVGTLDIGNRTDLKFAIALVSVQNDQDCLYIDRQHTKHFSDADRVCFHTPPRRSKALGIAETSVPLSKGPYKTYPLRLEIAPAPEGTAREISTTILLVSSSTLVTGDIKTPIGLIQMGYRYDPVTGTADPHTCVQLADLNRDGKLDEGSERDMAEDNQVPVFHVGRLYLRTAAVDLAAKRLTVDSVPASAYERFDILPGSTLPDFTVSLLDGRTIKRSSIKGHVILIDFWATWCQPCIADLPSLQAVYAKYHERGFEVLGMNGDSDIEKPQQLIAKRNITWPNAKPSTELLQKRFHILRWPVLILIDDHGRVLTSQLKDLFGPNLDSTLDKYLPTK